MNYVVVVFVQSCCFWLIWDCIVFYMLMPSFSFLASAQVLVFLVLLVNVVVVSVFSAVGMPLCLCQAAVVSVSYAVNVLVSCVWL